MRNNFKKKRQMKYFEQNNTFYYVYNILSIFFFFLNDYIISFEFSFNLLFDDNKKFASKSSLRFRIFRDFSRFRFIITFSIDLLSFSIDVFVLRNSFTIAKHTSILEIFLFYIRQFYSIIIDKILIWRIFWKFKNINIQNFVSYHFVKIVSIYFEFFKFFDTNQNHIFK